MNRRDFIKNAILNLTLAGLSTIPAIASSVNLNKVSKLNNKESKMKKIILVNSSPRVNGNSDNITKILAENLKECEVLVFNMREKKCNPCLACGVCQNKESAKCIQKDDISNIIDKIDTCDALVIATPIYNQQINSQAKLFIERWYPFFNFNNKLYSNTSKYGKKGALICSFWGSPVDITSKYAEWTVSGFSQIGVEHTKTLIFPQIPNKGDVLKRDDYITQIKELAKWLKE